MTSYHVLNILITTIVVLLFSNFLYIYCNDVFVEEMKKHRITRFFVRDLFGFEKKLVSFFTSYISKMRKDVRSRKFYISFLVLLLILLQYLDHLDVRSMALSKDSFNDVWSATPFALTYAWFMSLSMLITLSLLPYKISNRILLVLGKKRSVLYFALVLFCSINLVLSYASLIFFKTIFVLLFASKFYPPEDDNIKKNAQ